MDSLLLHICCAPDATVALERLFGRFDSIGYFYNPNISHQPEYQLRETEARRLVAEHNLSYIEEPQRLELWDDLTSGYHNEPERGERCRICIAHRLDLTAERAVGLGIKHFSTTLTTSPHKDVKFIHEAGHSAAERFGLLYVDETFRSRDGFRRSVELSQQFGLYRQNYCGCRWSYLSSLAQAEARQGAH